MRRKMTVVAVVHGYDDGDGVTAEVYPYDLTDVGGRAAELMSSWRPQPGELDDTDAVKDRLGGLRRSGVAPRTIEGSPRSAQGFVADVSESRLSIARQAAAGHHSPVYDESYTYEIGEVMVFDAEVDPQNMEVDWSTAEPHRPMLPGMAPAMAPAETAPQAGQAGVASAGLNQFGGEQPGSAVRRAAMAPLMGVGAVGGKAAAAARRHGPAVMSAAKAKLSDPKVQAQLRTVATTAIEVGLASKGGRSAQVASKAATAMRVGETVMAARSSGSARSAAGSLLSPAAAAVQRSAMTPRPGAGAGAPHRSGAQPGF